MTTNADTSDLQRDKPMMQRQLDHRTPEKSAGDLRRRRSLTDYELRDPAGSCTKN